MVLDPQQDLGVEQPRYAEQPDQMTDVPQVQIAGETRRVAL